MCGISILLDPAGSPDFVSRLFAMHAVIRHRGPDGEGFLAADQNGGVTRWRPRRCAVRRDRLMSALRFGG